MKRIFYLLLIIFISNHIDAQEIKKISKDTTGKLINYIWKTDKDYIFENLNSQGDYFYRVYGTKLSEGESNLEGECLDHLILLKGEYGEYPDGELYDLGNYYNVIYCILGQKFLTIIYGNKDDPKFNKIPLP